MGEIKRLTPRLECLSLRARFDEEMEEMMPVSVTILEMHMYVHTSYIGMYMYVYLCTIHNTGYICMYTIYTYVHT